MISLHSELPFDRGVDFENLKSTSGGTLENVPSAHHRPFPSRRRHLE